jgi:DNA-directed RNA polymerase specialized sigma24 family protein
MIGFEWVELEYRLQKMRDEAAEDKDDDANKYYRIRKASIAKKEKEEKEKEIQVTGLLVEGYNTEEISYILDMPLSEVARLEERSRETLEFLATGELPKEPGVFTIFTGIPTARKES